jgi:putative flippase GtrA
LLQLTDGVREPASLVGFRIVSIDRSAFAARRRRDVLQFARFAVVGASGVVVTMVALIVLKRLGPAAEVQIIGLPPTQFHVRWYHVYSTGAFLIANLWNFGLNRRWTFNARGHGGWLKQYWPFLSVGLVGQGLGLVLLTLLMHRSSPLSLPTDLLDGSSGLRTRLYWAQLIVIAVVTPLTFALNKLWTFGATRSAGPLTDLDRTSKSRRGAEQGPDEQRPAA